MTPALWAGTSNDILMHYAEKSISNLDNFVANLNFLQIQLSPQSIIL